MAQDMELDVDNAINEVKDQDQTILPHPDTDAIHSDVRIGVIGNVDSGKSTMIGVLVSGELDDGRGSARSKVFRFKHEQDNGRTSSISHHIMGFDDKGEAVFQTANASAAPAVKNKSWQRIVDNSKNIATFIDLCGHEKYLKTTISGLTGSSVHYACVLVGGNMGVQKMTKEHIGVAIALEIPLFVVITKVDLAPENVLKKTLKDLFKILKHPQCGKMPLLMKKSGDIDMCFGDSNGSLQSRICPVFVVSATKGTNMDLLRTFISRLRATDVVKKDTEKKDDEIKDDIKEDPAVMQIDDTFSVAGVGVVVSGVLRHGTFRVNEQVCLGPFSDGTFKQVVIRGLHVKRTAVQEVKAGVSCAVAIRGKGIRRETIRRGMVLISEAVNPKPVYGFQAEVLILHHPTTIKNHYQCVIHCGCTRQAASLEVDETAALRTGDRALVNFRFLYYPEWVEIGDTIIFREGSTKGVGKIVSIDHDKDKPTKDKKET
jgi:GTPase